MLTPRPSVLVAFACFLVAAGLYPTPADSRVRWSTPGEYRLYFEELRPFTIDSEGKESAEQALARHRLRLKPTVEMGALSVHLELDVLTGQIFGTTTAVGSDFAQRRELTPDDPYDGWTTVEPRQGWFELYLPWASMKVGQFSDHWGLGLIQHGGDAPSEDDGWVLRPGTPWLGDLVTRAQISLRPVAPFSRGDLSRLRVTLGGGIVYQDEEGTLFDEDDTVQYLASLEYPGDDMSAGLEYLHRDQHSRGSATLQTTTLSAYGKWRAPLFLQNAVLKLETEYVAVFGERRQPDTFGDVEPVALNGWAAVARLEYRLNCPRVTFGADVGHFSGDRPDTEENEGYRADPDFSVGFLLFPEVIRQQTVRSAERLRQYEKDTKQFLGANELPTKGAVRNATYFATAVSWRPGSFLLGLYALAAWAPEPFFDPLNTRLGGAGPVNALGDVASTYYGTELTFITQYQLNWARYTGARMGITAGVLLPGDAISEGDAGDPITKIVWSLDLGW
jgi:hypothetical protein